MGNGEKDKNYINKLEEEIKLLNKKVVTYQSEMLTCYFSYLKYQRIAIIEGLVILLLILLFVIEMFCR